MNLDEAIELNSECAFCGKPKFEIFCEGDTFELKRCTDEHCDRHCKFNHKVKLEFVEASEDRLAIGSGWNTH